MRISPLISLRRAGRSGVLALCAALVVSVVTPAGQAAAAAASTPTKSTTTSSASASAGKTSTAKTGTTAKTSKPSSTTLPAKTPLPTKKTLAKPSAPIKARHATPLAPTEAKQARAAAARSALSAADVPDTCSGQISSDTIYPCSTPSSTGTDTFTLTVTDATDLLLIRALSTSGNTLGITVTAPDSTVLNCQSTDLTQCATSAAGTYTLQVASQSSDYTLDYTALLSDTSCATADPSFATGVLQGNVAAGETGACYTLNMASGDVLTAELASTSWDEANATVFDATGTQICIDDQGNCTLTGTAPYRVRIGDLYGRADGYYATFNDLTHPQGCLTVAQQIYGSVPDQSSADECRTIVVTTPGNYQIYGVSAGNGELNMGAALYNPDGSAACTNAGPTCQLAAGTYNAVVGQDPEFISPLGLVFIAANESRGCTATGDTDFASGPATGTFGGLGEEVCLTLPTAAGSSDYVFNQQTATGASEASVQILDATGASVCSIAYAYVTCALTGTAPFREILSAQAAGGGYRLLTQRTDSTSGCSAWPQSGFGGSFGAQVKLTATLDVGCLSIPAAQHSLGEMIDYSNTANTVNGAIYINDPKGAQVCVGTTTTVCSYTAGVAYTALVITTSQTGDTYDVVRRDVSQTASCSTPSSTTVGGASSGLVLTSDLYAACYRVTGATTDKWWFDVRTLAPGSAGAVLEVTNPTGTIICRQWGESCNVTGSTSYQAIVIAAGYAGISISGHVDTWKVGTSAGWASQCTAHQLSANGWAPLSATLTETSSAYCAEVAVKPIQYFGVYGTATGSGLSDPWLSMYTTADWANGIGLCSGTNYGQFGFSCGTQSSDAAGEAVMIVFPSSAPAPVGFTIQGVCQQGCATPPATATISSISPSTGAAGSNKVVIDGTNLTLGTKVALASNGSPAGSFASPLSVNSAGTALTLLLDTGGVTPGKYDIVLGSVGYTVGQPSAGYLPGAYTVTPAPVVTDSKFTPVNTVRILDTRKGLGAPKARVGAVSGVTLKVAGVGGVPSSGATAVLVNVTSVSPTAGGNLEVYPDSESRPGTSTVNFGTGQTVANLAVVPLVDGKIDLYNDSPGQVDILADVSGYYTATTGSLLTTTTPTAILDTRSGLGAPKAKVASDATVALTVKGAGGVPSSGATAVLVDVTGINPTASGNIEVYPDTLSASGSSTLNFTPGKTVSNEAVVRLIDGKIDLRNNTPGTTDMTVDVLGYFSATGSSFQPENTVRVLDTRSGLGGSGETVIPHGAAVLNVMNLPGVPPTITAVVLNVTVTSTQQAGSMTVFADGNALPPVPDYTFAAGSTVAGLVTVPVVNGKVDFYNGSPGTVQVIADLAGYYLS
jgi:hypothetical protein